METPDRAYDHLKFTIHNPNNPMHFMRIRRLERHVRVLNGDTVIADSQNALRLTEIGRDVYEPAIYVPIPDIVSELAPLEGETYCPLKGHCTYYAFKPGGERVAWHYHKPLDFAKRLEGHISFYPQFVTFVEGPAQS